MENVCIIDDDIMYQFMAKKILSDFKEVNQIKVFPDGEKAYDFLKEYHNKSEHLPGLIFLDINMPIMDGWTFLELFNELKPNLSKSIIICMVSSSHEKIDMERTLSNESVAEYIIKPITREMFQIQIKTFLTNTNG
tara:strand:+ start:273 stop:680 length:408 start_codon:yes stop_codon:yes gene_type:complete